MIYHPLRDLFGGLFSFSTDIASLRDDFLIQDREKIPLGIVYR
jgi:hypothetical protein